MSTARFIYKICTLDEWGAFQNSGSFSGNDLDQETGYLHLSLPRQLPRIVEKYFNSREQIVFLEIPLEKVKTHLKWEPNSKGDLFPHFYGVLEREHVEGVFKTLDGVLSQDPVENTEKT